MGELQRDDAGGLEMLRTYLNWKDIEPNTKNVLKCASESMCTGGGVFILFAVTFKIAELSNLKIVRLAGCPTENSRNSIFVLQKSAWE